MAYNDSGEMPIGQSYQLGEYAFSITVSHDPGESETGINVRCDKGDERAVVSGEVTGTVESWSVEANEDTAEVYVTVQSDLDTSPLSRPVPCAPSGTVKTPTQTQNYFFSQGSGMYTTYAVSSSHVGHLAASSDPNAKVKYTYSDGGGGDWTLDRSFTYQGQTVYYRWVRVGATLAGGRWTEIDPVCNDGQFVSVSEAAAKAAAWTMVFGEPQKVTETLIARFAIDIIEAGGGPDGDWDEPGDDGPPGTTLNVTVTGATAGSCTGTPSDNLTVKGYGDGGDGGYGGGGGAGASTVIIYEFATDLASSVNQEAISRGPGTGGPGGKGGKGGDGCILIFY